MRGAWSSSPHVEGATNGGKCTNRGTTRRRHAEGRLLMRLFAFKGVGGVGMERDGTPCGGAVPRVLLCCGGVLLSHNLSVAVPLALPGLASRFGMVLGVSPVL